MERIIIVSDMIPPGYGGAGLAAYKHACILNQENILHGIITRTPEVLPEGFPSINKFDRSELENLLISRVAPKSSYLLTNKFGLLKRVIPLFVNNTRLFLDLLRILNRYKRQYGIMHCYSTTWLSLFSTIIAKIIGKKVILEMSLVGHDDPRSVSKNDKLRIKFLLKRLQFRLSDRIISKSLALSEEYLKTKMDPNKLVLIPYGIDTSTFKKPDKTTLNSLKRDLNVDQFSPLLLFVGSITSRKGVDIVFKAFPLIKARYQNAGMILIGNDSTQTDDPGLHSTVTSIKADPNSGIIIKDPVQNIKDYMFAADLFFFPSRREGFGIVIIEAMASNLPVVVKKIHGVTDYIINRNENGTLIDSEDENEFFSHISFLLDNKDVANDLSKNGRERVRNNFDTSIIEMQYQQLYQSIS